MERLERSRSNEVGLSVTFPPSGGAGSITSPIRWSRQLRPRPLARPPARRSRGGLVGRWSWGQDESFWTWFHRRMACSSYPVVTVWTLSVSGHGSLMEVPPCRPDDGPDRAGLEHRRLVCSFFQKSREKTCQRSMIYALPSSSLVYGHRFIRVLSGSPALPRLPARGTGFARKGPTADARSHRATSPGQGCSAREGHGLKKWRPMPQKGLRK